MLALRAELAILDLYAVLTMLALQALLLMLVFKALVSILPLCCYKMRYNAATMLALCS